MNSHEYIRKRTYCSGHIKEVLCMLQLSNTNWSYVGPRASQPYPPPPLHSPFVSKSLTRDTKGAGGRGRGRCWSSSASYAPAEFSHGSDPSNMPVHLSFLMGHPSLDRTPLSEHQSQRCPAQQQRSLRGGGGGGREPRRGSEAGRGWGDGGKRMCCIFEIPPLWEKIVGPLHWNPTYIPSMDNCNYLTLSLAAIKQSIEWRL